MVIAPSASDFEASYNWVRSMSFTRPKPSHRGHMPPATVYSFTVVWPLPLPLATVIAPLADTEGTLNENALGEPMWGWPRRLKTMRSMALASVAVPTVEREFAPMRSWSTMMAVVRPSRTSTSGRDRLGMNPCTNAL